MTTKKDILIAVGIVVFLLVYVWAIQDSASFHPEVPQYSSDIP
jgi:hypothetical protein